MTAIESTRAHRRAGVERVRGVAAERERVHGHRDHVAEHEQPQQQAGELRVTLLAEMVERAAERPERAVTPAHERAVTAASTPPSTKHPNARWPASAIATPSTLKIPPPIIPPTAIAVASTVRRRSSR